VTDRLDQQRLGDVVVIGVALLMAAAASAFMVFLKAPSVVEARPELQDAGFWTALFSGRF